jgi:glycosyltransferase involved in cell wall biosynthesis
MNILHIMPAYIPAYRYGGPVRSVHDLCRKLVESGHVVTVFTTNFDGVRIMDVPLNTPCNIDGVIVYYFSVDLPFFYFRSMSLKRKLKRTIEKFDLVHIHCIYVYTTFVASRLAKKFNIPYVVSPRGMLDGGAIKIKGTLKKKLYLRLVERKTFSNAGLIHYTSEDESIKSVFSKLTKNVVIISNGLDIEKYQTCEFDNLPDKYTSLQHKKIVLFLGRINYIKGLDILANSWPKIVSSFPDAQLIIAGPNNDNYKESIVAIIKSLGVTDSVTFTGELDFEDKVKFIKTSEVLVAPSYLESFGMSIVEAMACSKPVIISNKVNIYPIIQKYDAGIITSCDKDEVASAVINIFNNVKNSTIKGNNGNRLVCENFALDATTEKMILAYRNLINGY